MRFNNNNNKVILNQRAKIKNKFNNLPQRKKKNLMINNNRKMKIKDLIDIKNIVIIV